MNWFQRLFPKGSVPPRRPPELTPYPEGHPLHGVTSFEKAPMKPVTDQRIRSENIFPGVLSPEHITGAKLRAEDIVGAPDYSGGITADKITAHSINADRKIYAHRAAAAGTIDTTELPISEIGSARLVPEEQAVGKVFREPMRYSTRSERRLQNHDTEATHRKQCYAIAEQMLESSTTSYRHFREHIAWSGNRHATFKRALAAAEAIPCDNDKQALWFWFRQYYQG